jgi:hypothetical protein
MEKTLFEGIDRPVNSYIDDLYWKMSGGLTLLIYQMYAYYSLEGTFSTASQDVLWEDIMPKIESDEKSNEKKVENEIPKTYSIQNYPNPFNPTTTFSLQLPDDCNVKLKIYDALGREVSTIVNKYLSAGSHNFEFNSRSNPSGVYFYDLKAGKFSKTGKILLMK